MDFGSISVTQLKEYLKVRGVSAASTVGKNGLVQLCHVSKNLSEDPDFEKCDTWEKITKKLGKIGIFKDPTEMNFANVTMSNVPRFGMMDIFNYLLFHRADYDQRKLQAYKSFNDYQLFAEGHVRELAVTNKNNHYIFRAYVVPTCKVTTYLKTSTYACWFILNSVGDVYTAYCQCMGG